MSVFPAEHEKAVSIFLVEHIVEHAVLLVGAKGQGMIHFLYEPAGGIIHLLHQLKALQQKILFLYMYVIDSVCF